MKLGHKAKLIHVSGFLDILNPAIQDFIGPADLIIVQRNLVHQSVFDAFEYWQGLGKAIAVDLDDAYQMLPWSNPAHHFWVDNPEHMDPPPLYMLEEGLRRAGHLIAPNRVLLQDWSHVARGYYIPNFARAEWWTNLPSRAEAKQAHWNLGGERIVIGWGGSVSHYDAWWGTGIREAARVLCHKYPDLVWVICGNDPRIYEQLPVPLSQKIMQPGVPPDQWPGLVKAFDIGVAPLFGPYDQRRSWIKGLEYLLAGVPWVGTAGEPYRDLANLGTLIANSPAGWEFALDQKIKGLRVEQEQADDKVKNARQWFTLNQISNLVSVYQSICNDADRQKGRLTGVVRVAAEH